MYNKIKELFEKILDSKEYLFAVAILILFAVSVYYYWYVPNYVTKPVTNTSSSESGQQQANLASIQQFQKLQNQHQPLSDQQIKAELAAMKLAALVNTKSEQSQAKVGVIKNFLDVISLIDSESEDGQKVASQLELSTDFDDVVLISEPGYVINIGEMSPEQIVYAFRVGNENAKKMRAEQSMEKESSESPVDLKSLGVIVLTKEGCVPCIRTKKYLAETGLDKEIMIIPHESEQGQEYMKKISVQGFPTFVSLKTGKTNTGAPIGNLDGASKEVFTSELIKRLTL